MKRSRRRFGLPVLATFLVAVVAWPSPRSVEAHTCVIGPVPNVTFMAPGCQAEADNPPWDHACLDNTEVVTVFVCVDFVPQRAAATTARRAAPFALLHTQPRWPR